MASNWLCAPCFEYSCETGGQELILNWKNNKKKPILHFSMFHYAISRALVWRAPKSYIFNKLRKIPLLKILASKINFQFTGILRQSYIIFWYWCRFYGGVSESFFFTKILYGLLIKFKNWVEHLPGLLHFSKRDLYFLIRENGFLLYADLVLIFCIQVWTVFGGVGGGGGG